MDQPNEKAPAPLIDHLDVAACVAAIRKRKADALSDARVSEEAVQVAAGVLRLLPKALETAAVGPRLVLRFESEQPPSALYLHRAALLLSTVTEAAWWSSAEGSLAVKREALEAALLARAARDDRQLGREVQRALQAQFRRESDAASARRFGIAHVAEREGHGQR